MRSILLAVYSLVSRAVCRLKSGLVRVRIMKERTAPIPVISVGNLTLGGSEKTPLVVVLLGLIEGLGLKPALIARGYKGRWEQAGGVLSDGRTLFGGWKQAGDESYMIARRFPQAGVFVGKRRYRSCLTAFDLGFHVAILDDGFQHLKLARDFDIVLYDERSTAPFREGFSALRRADILLWKAGGRGSLLENIRKRFPNLSVYEYTVEAKGLRRLGDEKRLPVSTLKGEPVVAFSGIARPGRFFALLEETGMRIAARSVFPDHFAYPTRALDRLAAACRSSRSRAVVTTDKDAVKIADRFSLFSPNPVYVLEIGLELPAAFFTHVRDSLAAATKITVQS